MKRNKKWKSKMSPTPPTTAQKDPIFTEEDREAEAQRLAACICDRKNTTVQCLRCGNLCFGRMSRSCPTHPKIMFLYDIRVCSICMATAKDLEELPIDHETFKKLSRVAKPRSSA